MNLVKSKQTDKLLHQLVKILMTETNGMRAA